MPDREKLMLTRDAICSGLNTMKSAYERCEEDHNIVYFVGEYGTGQVAHRVSVPTLLSDAIELLKNKEVKVVQRIAKSEDNGTYFTMIWYECEECGHKINGDDIYCAGCGKKVDRSEVIRNA